MKKDTINLADTLEIFKKNLKGFYLFIAAGLLIGFFGVYINSNYLEKKTVLSSKISIKNPLENYYILDLFSLDTIQVDEKKVSITATQDKIKTYYSISREYMELVLSTIDLKKYDIDAEKYGYKINSEKKENDFLITIRNVSNPDQVKENLKKMVNDFNKLIQPIILKNITIETAFIESFLEISQDNPDSQRLAILIQIRKESLKGFENQDIEIFDLSTDQVVQKITNIRIITVSILMSFSFFLLFILLKK